MSVRFKFRSSLNYESIDIGERDSIAVADLKSRIRRHRNVNVSSSDCDLVLADALTGLEYRDDHVKVRSGSSVIIKRVPAGSVPAMCFVKHDQPSLDCDVNASDPLFPTQGGRMSPPGLKPVAHGHLKSKKAGKPFSISSKDKLSSEFKCSLCDQFYRAAVMIPCCQNSFCEPCIRLELINNSQCPRCSSTKCRVEDLLPNISLRHAVEHFLESGVIFDGVEGFPHQQVSDGESGNNAIEDSGEVTILKRDKLVRSSVINEIVGATAECLKFRTNTANTLEDETLSCKEIGVNDEEVGSSCPRGTEVVYPDFQGESESIQKQGRDICSLEAESMKIQRGRDCYMCGSSDHLIKECPVTRAHGSRACYICGSFDHLMRDCQEGSKQRSMPGRGAFFPFWNPSPMNYARTSGDQFFGSMESAFNPLVVPGASFPVPSNMPLSYGILPAYSGFMRYGWTPYAAGIDANQYLTSQGLTNFQKRSTVSGDNMRRDSYIDVAVNKSILNKGCNLVEEKSDNPEFHRRDSQSVSDRSFSLKPLENHPNGRGGNEFTFCSGNGRSRRNNNPSSSEQRSSHHYELSFSDGKDSPCCSSYLEKERHCHHLRSSKKHGARRTISSNDDLGRSCSQPDTRDLKRKRMELDRSRHSEKHPKSSDRDFQWHGVEAEVDKNCSHSSRDSKHRQTSGQEERNKRGGSAHERWRTNRSNEDIPGHRHHHKSRKKLGKWHAGGKLYTLRKSR